MPPAFATQLSAQLHRLPVLGTCMSASSWCVQGSLRAVIGSNGIAECWLITPAWLPVFM
jgi:hypothetical protein